MSSPGDGARPSRPRIAGPIPIPVALAFLLAFAPSVGAQTAAPAPGDQPAFATESSVRELQSRIEDLERRLGASALLELSARVDRLTKEVQELRDHAEVQARTIEALQGRQQDLYAELDRLAQRLARPAPEVEIGGAAPDTGAAPSVPATEPGADTAAASPGEEPGEGESGETGPAAQDDAASGGPEPAPASPSPYDPVEEQDSYQLAFDLLMEGRFEQCADAYTKFLADYPESRYRDDARFWKGDCLYALRRFEPALEEFRTLADDHPESAKIPDARLKIGLILHELGRSAEAVEELRALVEAAPESSAAKLARDRLERLQ